MLNISSSQPLFGMMRPVKEVQDSRIADLKPGQSKALNKLIHERYVSFGPDLTLETASDPSNRAPLLTLEESTNPMQTLAQKTLVKKSQIISDLWLYRPTSDPDKIYLYVPERQPEITRHETAYAKDKSEVFNPHPLTGKPYSQFIDGQQRVLLRYTTPEGEHGMISVPVGSLAKLDRFDDFGDEINPFVHAYPQPPVPEGSADPTDASAGWQRYALK